MRNCGRSMRPDSPGNIFAAIRNSSSTASPNSILWAAHALPSVIALTSLPAELADPYFQPPLLRLDPSFVVDGAEHLEAEPAQAFDEIGIEAQRRQRQSCDGG